jgi:phospholipid/cholesterol/gamma-HCH transport system ATP-binding protein
MNPVPREPHLEISHLGFTFSSDKAQLLKEINLALHAGDRLGILGPSGSGKSTLLKLVSGLLIPSQGEIRLDGEPIDRRDFRKSRSLSQKMAMSFQKGGLLDSYNAWENIDFALAELTDLSESERKERSFQFLRQVGLSGSENKKLKELSGGMLKRLSLARVFSLSPSILLLDDPTAGLDPVTADEIVSIIEDYAETRKVILIFASADLAVSFRLANRVGFLWKGSLNYEQSVHGFKKSDNPAIQQFIRGELSGPLTEPVYART